MAISYGGAFLAKFVAIFKRPKLPQRSLGVLRAPVSEVCIRQFNESELTVHHNKMCLTGFRSDKDASLKKLFNF